MKTAAILMSMGGPASLEGVRPFLFNLFKDPAILRLPFFIRIPLAFYLARRREKAAIENYKKLGGSSPLLANTKAQAAALEKELSKRGAFRCFVGMRYAPPFIDEMMAEVKKYAPDRLVFLPLYPQFSTTTTASALREAQKEAKRCGFLEEPITEVLSFHTDAGFIEAMAQKVEHVFDEAKRHGNPKVIFTAHGLPLSVVRAGDPYPQQCAETMAAILAAWKGDPPHDPALAYQSRVGRAAWQSPTTSDTVLMAAREKRPIILVPISFVSEHVETLVELEQEAVALGIDAGSPFARVVPTVGTDALFIKGLAALIVKNTEKTRK
ncbi:MAG: ferrochelatase [Bdellovibrionales bacterium]|jgi:ferrochelatase